MTKVSLTLPTYHAGQTAVDNHPARFKVVACGRRWGKTDYAVNKSQEIALSGSQVWWVAPTYGHASIGWELFLHFANQIPGTQIKRDERKIWYPGGGWLQAKSADDPDSLRGVGLDFVVMEEAAFMKEDAWTAAIRPALADREGSALIISTPKGRNWFWHAWQRGLDPFVEDWQSWQVPTLGVEIVDNQLVRKPHPMENAAIRFEEVLEAFNTLPEQTFREEFLAEFLAGEGTVFRNIGACTHAPKDARPSDHPGHRFVMGVDWGKQNDFTALSVGCADCRVEVALDRFNQIDWSFQRQRLAALSQRWGVEFILAEANAMGEPNIEALRQEGMPVAAFTTTASSKPPLIENLALALEKEEWQFIDDPVGVSEMEAYERKVSGNTQRSTYAAPEGLHDDTVIGRALMIRAAGEVRLSFVLAEI